MDKESQGELNKLIPVRCRQEDIEKILDGTKIRIPLIKQPEYGISDCFYCESGFAYTSKEGTCSCREVKHRLQEGDMIAILGGPTKLTKMVKRVSFEQEKGIWSECCEF